MKQTRVTLIDDLDPTEETLADETVSFALDGIAYTIDLSSTNAGELRAALQPFVQAGRRTGKTPAARRSPARAVNRSTPKSTSDTATIRSWAEEQRLIAPGKRGRLSQQIIDMYNRRSRPRQSEEAPGEAEFNAPQYDTAAVQAALQEAKEKAASAPRRPLSAVRTEDSEPADAPQEDAAEAAAREHYEQITRHDSISGELAQSRSWKNRTASGNPRTDKVEQWSLVERIAALTPFNIRVLHDLDTDTRNKTGVISGLKTSAARLQNLEFIQHAPGTRDDWQLTRFGRYAYEVRSSQTA